MNRSPFRRQQAKLQVVRAAADEVELLLYDEVGFFGITSKEFRRELDAIDAREIHLRVNSPGGDVFEGIAMHNAIRAHPARVIAHVDAGALSIAAYIVMAADEIVMADNAHMMIHNAWTIALGDAPELRRAADMLEQLDGSQEAAFTRKSGQSLEQIRAWLAEEKWFTAPQALEAGMADSVETADGEEAVNELAARFDLSVFAHLPEPLRGQPAPSEPTIRDLERALRDVGLSQIAAKQYVAAGRAAATQRDVDVAGERDVTPELRFLIGV